MSKQSQAKVDRERIAECLAYMNANNTSLRRACELFHLPVSTAHYHKSAAAHGKVCRPNGGISSLPPALSKEIAHIARTAAAHGFGFPAKNLHSTWHGTPGVTVEGTTYTCNESGWMTMETFTDWFSRSFLSKVPQRPALLIFTSLIWASISSSVRSVRTSAS